MPAALKELSYTHEAMVDLLVQRPMISQGDVARHFGYTEGWVSQIIRSDGFRELIAARKKELVDPVILQGLEQRMEALASRSADILMDALELKRSPEVALKALEVSSRALGYGAAKLGVNIQQNFVVAMPQKSVDSDSWVVDHKPRQPIGGGALSTQSIIDVAAD